MPRKPSVDKVSIFAVLCNSKEAIVQNGKIATPAASVWKELSQQLEDKMSAKALYTFVKLNRHNIWSALEISDQESNSEGELDSHCISPGQENCQAFELEVPFEDWVKFIPEKVEYNDKFSPTQKREYTILKPGTWTHIINDLIWKKIKNTCTLVFRRAKVHPTVNNNYLDIRGDCKECHGQL